MITYLVNSTLCSGLLLAVYHLLLKNKAMYNFNRYYLLASIFFSLTVPLIVIQHGVTPLPSILPVQSQIVSQGDFISGNPANGQLVVASRINYWFYAGVLIYSVITLLLVFRLLRNLYTIRLTRVRNEKVNYKGVQLVLIDKRLTPHTFLNYIFLNKEDYDQRLVEEAVLHHELAHARQWHSADIILTELIQAFYWFNPFFILYRKAIRVNHEFIADTAALNNGNDLSVYQNLLIGKAAQLQSLPITSQFNYSITKKRLIMMTKTTSPLTAWCIRLALIPVVGTAFILFCNKTEAQQLSSNNQAAFRNQKEVTKVHFPLPLVVRHPFPSTKNGISLTLMSEYVAYEKKYAATRLHFGRTITKLDQARMEQLYQQMSPAQQKDRAIFFMHQPEPRPGSPVSSTELESWKDPFVYGVWVDGRRVNNSTLKNYQPSDFNKIFFSRLTDRAVKHDGFHYQIELMTLSYYKKYRDRAIANRNNSMMVVHLKG